MGEDQHLLRVILEMFLSEFYVNQINGLTDEKRYGNYFLENSMRLANCLKQAGVQSDDIIAIVSENRFEFANVVCATYILGAILAPINLTYSERKYSFRDSAVNSLI